MRIIGGKLKNKKIYFPNNSKTRPLKDSVRENIFNIIKHSNNNGIEIKGSKVLDLYAGTGSFGLESLSREASKVVFVENNTETVQILRKNIEELNCQKKTRLVNAEILKFNDYLTSEEYKEKFNIIFLDPPYKNKEFLELIKIIKINKLYNDKHLIIIHREIRSEDKIENFINVIEKRVYGRSEIFFCRILWA